MIQPTPTPTILCLASYFKGERFLEACKRAGAHVILVTREKLAGEPWPMEAIDERFLMMDLHVQPEIIHAISYLARTRRIDRIVALDEYDTHTAATLREHLRIPGMGETTGRYFRDKLAMRMKAEEAGLRVPAFVHANNNDALLAYMERVPGPWVLKPRAEASAMGIQKIESQEGLWKALEELGDRKSFFLLEKFLPGEVYHVDAVVWQSEVIFAAAHQYGKPPMSVYQGGGVFITRTLPHDKEDTKALLQHNREVIEQFGLVQGVTHCEFIKSAVDGAFYFLEVAARVGGAFIDRLVETAYGINLWEEWARLEVAAASRDSYLLPDTNQTYAGLLLCLSRQAHPDLSAYDDPEVVWKVEKPHHAGLILCSSDAAIIQDRLEAYSVRFAQDFLASAPPLEQAPD